MDARQTIILGAGPAGLFAAGRVSAAPGQVLVLEKQPEPGRKLLLTGSGQCNFTHAGPILEFLKAYGEHGEFLKPALLHFTNEHSIAFFRSRGVAAMTVPETGKVFPRTRRSRDILDALRAACREKGAEIRCHQRAHRVRPLASGGFEIAAGEQVYQAQRVLIATGGASYPATGSTGDGWKLAQSLGHTLVPPRPGLAPFKIKAHPLAGLTGLSFKNLSATLWRQNRKIKTLSHDLVLTHTGISGPVVHNLARYALAGDTVTLAFVAAEDPNRWQQTWLEALERSGKTKVRACLKTLSLPKALTEAILVAAGVDPETHAARLSRRQRLKLARLATAFPLEIESVGDWSSAMVTCGGVALDEVDPHTMESRRVKGLYFAGEVLDIDGDSGGYDLQAAWSTAALAAEAMNAQAQNLPPLA